MSSKNQTKTCEYCLKSYLAKKGQRFCSNSCGAFSKQKDMVCPVCKTLYFNRKQVVCSKDCIGEFQSRLNNNDPEARAWLKQFTQTEESLLNSQCSKCGPTPAKITSSGVCMSCIRTQAIYNPQRKISFSDSDWLCQTNDLEGDILQCVVCGKGPFPRDQRVDTENGGYQVFCSPCYQLALQ